jgi:hypothetical protein
MIAERAAGADPHAGAEAADRALADFVRERHRGTRPIAYGRQLQEWAILNAVYLATLGLAPLVPAAPADGATTEPSAGGPPSEGVGHAVG